MKTSISTIFLILNSFLSFSQDLNTQEITYKVEEFILVSQKDSANFYVNKLNNSGYKLLLSKIITRKNISYKEYYTFLNKVANRASVDYNKVSDFIDTFIEIPKEKTINTEYYNIKWDQIFKLRDEVGLEKASKKQQALENYVALFNTKDIEVKKAKLQLNTHPIVMYLIENDLENGKKLALESLEEAKKLKDKELQIAFLYHLSDFLVAERKLQEYIDVSEESLVLEASLEEKSPFYFATTQHLIDAYIYKGGNNKRVNILIDEMYKNPLTKIQTYSYYLKLIGYSEPNSTIKNEILDKFAVKNVKELVAKFKILGKDLNPNDFYYILREGSIALEKNNFYKEALRIKDESINLNKKIYSEDLSKSLASYKTEQAVKEKEIEIASGKEKNKFYIVIIILAIILLIISLLVIRKIKKQAKLLKEKNKLITKTLKEKELLVKEVHHRVKNNFQIVSSLLELQSKGIEDEKALELANEGKNRVKSMALIHQKLYQNETGLVDFDEYIQLLTKELSALYASKNKVTTKINSKNVKLDVDTAIPLGLIINEIITNSYKYAFKNDKKNNLSISISKAKENNFKLVIEDNGPGLKNNFDVSKANSLGLRLVNRLVKQLHGTLKQSNSKGAKFEIYFKDTFARQLVN